MYRVIFLPVLLSCLVKVCPVASVCFNAQVRRPTCSAVAYVALLYNVCLAETEPCVQYLMLFSVLCDKLVSTLPEELA